MISSWRKMNFGKKESHNQLFPGKGTLPQSLIFFEDTGVACAREPRNLTDLREKEECKQSKVKG